MQHPPITFEKTDQRPQKAGWAPGTYMCKCFNCEETFIGDKRAVACADCAYNNNWLKIETAPKDGTEILVPYPIWQPKNRTEIPDEYRVMIVHWNGTGWDRGGWVLHEEPKFWQELPVPPPLEN